MSLFACTNIQDNPEEKEPTLHLLLWTHGQVSSSIFQLQIIQRVCHKHFWSVPLLTWKPRRAKSFLWGEGGKKKCIHTLPRISRSNFTAHLTLNSRIQIATSALLHVYVLPSVHHQQYWPLDTISYNAVNSLKSVFLSSPRRPCVNW